MPLCIILAPQGISDSSKEKLMGKLTTHIHAAYPNTVTEVFLQEIDRSSMMVNGIRLTNSSAREVRFCTLICPPGLKADAKKAMMENVSAEIGEAYPSEGHTWIIEREDDPGSVMLNGHMLSEKWG
jgi:phenylpyruvate tautomerase PptA (4-oxalocrotonate tautomerase family)